MSDKIKDYLASIGSKGGKTVGAAKRRGNSDYYKKLSKKAAKARAKRSEK